MQINLCANSPIKKFSPRFLPHLGRAKGSERLLLHAWLYISSLHTLAEKAFIYVPEYGH